MGRVFKLSKRVKSGRQKRDDSAGSQGLEYIPLPKP